MNKITINSKSDRITQYPIKLAPDGSIRYVRFFIKNFRNNNPLPLITVINQGDDIIDSFGNVIYHAGNKIHYRYTLTYIPNHSEKNKILKFCDNNNALFIELDMTRLIKDKDKSSFDGYIGASKNMITNFNFNFLVDAIDNKINTDQT